MSGRDAPTSTALRRSYANWWQRMERRFSSAGLRVGSLRRSRRMESAFPCCCAYGATRMRLAEGDFFAVAVDEEFAVALEDEGKASLEIVGKIIDAGG